MIAPRCTMLAVLRQTEEVTVDGVTITATVAGTATSSIPRAPAEEVPDVD